MRVLLLLDLSLRLLLLLRLLLMLMLMLDVREACETCTAWPWSAIIASESDFAKIRKRARWASGPASVVSTHGRASTLARIVRRLARICRRLIRLYRADRFWKVWASTHHCVLLLVMLARILRLRVMQWRAIRVRLLLLLQMRVWRALLVRKA